MQITVADIQKLNVKDGETLVVFIDIKGHPRPMAEKIMQDAAKFMRGAIPNSSVQIIVVPQDKYSFGVIGSNTIPSNQIGQVLNGKPSIVTPNDAWDRAMKGIG